MRATAITSTSPLVTNHILIGNTFMVQFDFNFSSSTVERRLHLLHHCISPIEWNSMVGVIYIYMFTLDKRRRGPSLVTSGSKDSTYGTRITLHPFFFQKGHSEDPHPPPPTQMLFQNLSIELITSSAVLLILGGTSMVCRWYPCRRSTIDQLKWLTEIDWCGVKSTMIRLSKYD